LIIGDLRRFAPYFGKKIQQVLLMSPSAHFKRARKISLRR
jgi:hypothetical protein